MTESKEKFRPRQKQKDLSREKLMNMDKNELIDKIIQLETHNFNLKNVIAKSLETQNDKNWKSEFDFTKCHYRRVLLKVAYFGWDYRGLTLQEDSANTIEHHLFHALIKSCLIEARDKSQYHRCGRTDKGVSAFGQVISISLRSKFTPDLQNDPASIQSEITYCKILNGLLPKEIRTIGWAPIPNDKPEFSARFDCKERQYKYYFPKSSLNIKSMSIAASHLIGSHDFRHFCKMDVGNGVTEFIRRIKNAYIKPVDDTDCDKPSSMYAFIIEGNAFLWHQIRCIMGVLLLVGQGLESPDVIVDLLNVGDNPRKPQYNMALDTPLNLFNCSYEIEEQWVYDEEVLKKIIIDFQKDWTLYSIKATMIKDCLQDLQSLHKNIKKDTKNGENENGLMSKNEDNENEIMSHSKCLLQGVEAKVYKPLLKRQTCSSLEERLYHYTKKGKLEKE